MFYCHQLNTTYYLNRRLHQPPYLFQLQSIECPEQRVHSGAQSEAFPNVLPFWEINRSKLRRVAMDALYSIYNAFYNVYNAFYNVFYNAFYNAL